MDVKEVVARRLIAQLLPEHLDQRSLACGCRQSELVERPGRVMVSMRGCDPVPTKLSTAARSGTGVKLATSALGLWVRVCRPTNRGPPES